MQDVIGLIEEGKIKRYFRARKKICFEGAIGHITQRASGKEPLFVEGSDYLYMLYLIKEISAKFKLHILSFALMLNHIHLLVKFKEAGMSVYMKNLFERYAKYFNNKYKRKGHLFCGPFRSALCFDESYLLAASLYIHFNPVKAGLVKDSIDYRWSSCALFLKELEKDTFIDYKFVLGILDSDISKARIKYKELLEELKIRKIDNILERPKALDFIVQILKEKNNGWLKEHGLLGDSDLEHKIQDLREKKRLFYPEELKARAFLIEQLKSRGFSVSEVAEKLNLTRQTIYRAANVTKRV